MRRTVLLSLSAVALIAVALITTLYFTRTAEPNPPAAEPLPSRVQGETVTGLDLVGLPPSTAEARLGYPKNDPFGSPPRIIGQDPSVNLNAPTIITAVCMNPKSESERSSGTVVFEVANPQQISENDLALLKKFTYKSRRQHIKDATGCESDVIGVFVPGER
ncbi:hypothetical protein GM1_022_00020 [Gordonia malaquae NBRC 108250]|uniref:Uncharacterized protein n=1 Tax=Gordonia malaquae NBRC 108250 TaxID=1223542 RepID=M3VGC5_GORML|nr:hypothetical protein GM1_022_00020 [Gordonia malaquae NBRC 108250]